MLVVDGVVEAGFAGVPFIGLGELPAAVVPAGVVPLGLPFAAGVAAGVGNEVIGVGTGGKGLFRMPAIISFKPASDLFRNL